MILFGTEKAWKRMRFTKIIGFVAAIALLPLGVGHATNVQPSFVVAIDDLETASVVSIEGGYDYGFRPGMKLIASGESGLLAELIIVNVTEHRTQTLITELFGQAPLELGNPVRIKTINFAATWK